MIKFPGSQPFSVMALSLRQRRSEQLHTLGFKMDIMKTSIVIIHQITAKLSLNKARKMLQITADHTSKRQIINPIIYPLCWAGHTYFASSPISPDNILLSLLFISFIIHATVGVNLTHIQKKQLLSCSTKYEQLHWKEVAAAPSFLSVSALKSQHNRLNSTLTLFSLFFLPQPLSVMFTSFRD